MLSKCPSCSSTRFEAKPFEPTPAGSLFKLTAIQCASCGAVLSTIEFLNIGATLEKMEKKIDAQHEEVMRALSTINTNLIRIGKG